MRKWRHAANSSRVMTLLNDELGLQHAHCSKRWECLSEQGKRGLTLCCFWLGKSDTVKQTYQVQFQGMISVIKEIKVETTHPVRVRGQGGQERSPLRSWHMSRAQNAELNKSREGGAGSSGGEGHLGLREQEVPSMDGEPEDWRGRFWSTRSAFRTTEGRADCTRGRGAEFWEVSRTQTLQGPEAARKDDGIHCSWPWEMTWDDAA